MFRREKDSSSPASPRTPSVASFRTSNSGKSGRKGVNSSGSSRFGSSSKLGSTNTKDQTDVTGQIIELGESDDYNNLDETLFDSLKNAVNNNILWNFTLIFIFRRRR